MISSAYTWIQKHAAELVGKTLVTISMEGYIPELTGDAREANTRGGLGVYFGDKLEGLHAIGMERALGCMPLYRKRMVQSVQNGKQHIEYKDVSYEDQSIEPYTDKNGRPVKFEVWGWDVKNTAKDRRHTVQVYSICRGGIPLYLFDCHEVFDILYADDRTHHGYGREHRFLQETFFAQCVYEFLKRTDTVPDILHLNEGHVAGAAAIIRGDEAFGKTAVVYTNHTVVPAGMERFCVDSLTGGDLARARYAMRFPWPSHQKFWRHFSVQQNNQWFIDFSKGAIEICDVANGVSAEHAHATQTLFPNYDRTIEPVLNGSGDSWVLDELLEAPLKQGESPKEILTKINAKGKAITFAEIKKRTIGMTDKKGHMISTDGVNLDPALPTVWMVRRMVHYKSQLPILKDIIHVMCADRDKKVDTLWGTMNGLEMQVILGGLAPEGSNEEKWIEEFVRWMQRADLNGRFAFVPNADSQLLRMQAIGADICINCPLPEQEACGTSDQRTARNGGINIATYSGGPPEYIQDEKSGMLVGPYQNNDDFYKRAPKDILGKLTQLSDMYYTQNNEDTRWFDMKLASYLASPEVTAAAMEQRYAPLYIQAIRRRNKIIDRMDLGRRKPRHIKKLSDLFLQLNESARDFLYYDPKLKQWTVIAGLPYFDQRQGSQFYNWGRDTMIALPGLCLERERFDVFREIIKSHLRLSKAGLLPSLVGDSSNPRYNTIDTALWMFWAMKQYLEHTQDYAFLDTIIDRQFPQKENTTVGQILEEIIEAFRNGIQFEDRWKEYGEDKSQTIQAAMDSDGLISAGNENTPLTWMDVKPKGGEPVTSRHGKAVEINALWYNALRVMADIQKFNHSQDRGYEQLAENVKASFIKFWNPKTGCLYDTIDGDLEQGEKIRPNQVFAVVFGLLDTAQSQSVLSKVRQELLTPFGLRTLSLRDLDYHPVHNNEYSYHQGTVLPWLMGAFVDACIIIYGKKKTLRILSGAGHITALSQTLEKQGSIPEVFDGDCHCRCKHGSGKGCKGQAWNVGESLRVLSLLLTEDTALDVRKEEYPGSKIIYEMVIRDYYDDTNSLSGLVVALEELTFLAESGIEYIYLLGLMKHNGSPFEIIDPIDIDHRAGSFDDLEAFLAAAHKLGIKVIMDWLANQHVSKNSPLCTTYPDRFLYTDSKDGDYFLNKGMQLYTGKNRPANKDNLVLVSATDQVPLGSFPRRWSTLAQPDLSHPEVQEYALEIGRFWLSKGLDGFRIDAALSTFPDKIKENWGLDVDGNLTYVFIQAMRRIKPDCFIMFEGFERLEELLQLADYENCSVYNWQSRNLATDAIKDSAKLSSLIAYLKELEHTQHMQENLLNLGPEHDAFDFEDPWAKLDHAERQLLHFLHAFIPGYMLVFNGEIFGGQHGYKNRIDKTRPAPRIKDATGIEREIGKKLFSLRKKYPELVKGNYKFIKNGDQNVIHVARFDERAIMIGVMNTTSEEKELVLSLNDIIHQSLASTDIKQAHYIREVLLFKEDGVDCENERKDKISAENLLREGLRVNIAPGTYQTIRLHLDTI